MATRRGRCATANRARRPATEAAWWGVGIGGRTITSVSVGIKVGGRSCASGREGDFAAPDQARPIAEARQDARPASGQSSRRRSQPRSPRAYCPRGIREHIYAIYARVARRRSQPSFASGAASQRLGSPCGARGLRRRERCRAPAAPRPRISAGGGQWAPSTSGSSRASSSRSR